MDNQKYIPAPEGWYFVHPNTNPDGPPIVYQVAAFKADSHDAHALVGMVAALGKIIPAPPVDGRYLYRDQLSAEELEQAKQR